MLCNVRRINWIPFEGEVAVECRVFREAGQSEIKILSMYSSARDVKKRSKE